MLRAAFETLGCKVNQYETERIASTFRAAGFDIVEPRDVADVYVVNTCSVTQVAEAKSRKTIRRLARQNPDAVVVVTGCDVEMARLTGRPLPEATLVVGNEDKLQVLDRLLQAVPRLKESLATWSPTARPSPRSFEESRYIPSARTRAVIKVEDGCDMCCTFCSVRLTRGAVRSRPMHEVLREVREAVDCDRREIVLTGVLLGAYGRDMDEPGVDLACLLRAVASVEGVARVRLSSVEPTQVTDVLIAAIAETPKVCPHLHIPLQSGDDRILAAMKRPYDAAFYRDLIRRASERISDLAVTTDVLVGFPGEDDLAHRRTVELAREVGFARMHVFRFSPRPSTPAAAMDGQVSEGEKDLRAAEMASVARELRTAYAARYLGRTLEVLAEHGPRPGWLNGYTANYIRVQFPAGAHQPGDLVSVKLGELASETVKGLPDP